MISTENTAPKGLRTLLFAGIKWTEINAFPLSDKAISHKNSQTKC